MASSVFVLALVFGQVVVAKNAVGGTIEIIELARLQRPHEGAEPRKPQQQGRRDQVDQNAHALPPANLARNAFVVTRIEEPDMASAAISGVTKPAMAIGTATML